MPPRLHSNSRISTLPASQRHDLAWPLRERIQWVRRFRDLLVRHEQILAELAYEEIGKPHHEFLTGDMLPLLASCRWHERNARRLLAPQRLRGKGIWQIGKKHSIERVPMGHVAIIATWNYPVQLLGIQLLQAIVGGNEVTVKPSEYVPRTQQCLLDLAVQAELPEGVLRWSSPNRDAGHEMLREHHFDHIIFTGSTSVGREIAAFAAQHMIPTTLELSGRDSAFVLEDADPVLAAESIWAAITMNAGQTCMAPRRVLVQSGVYRRFLDALAPRVAGSSPCKVINEASAHRVWHLVQDAIERGARTISGLQEQPRGRDLYPVALVDCPPDALLVAGDHFGPAIAVVPVRTLEDALAIHNACDQHLATSIFSQNRDRVRDLTSRLSSSTVTINDCILPAAHPASSIGGSANSGWGMTQGREGLLAMTRPVHTSITSAWLRPSMQPPSAAVLRRLRKLTRWLYGGFASQTIPSSSDLRAAVPSVSSSNNTIGTPSMSETSASSTRS